MMSRTLASLLAIICSCTALIGQDLSTFNGTWMLQPLRSEVLPDSPTTTPRDVVLVIEQFGDRLQVDQRIDGRRDVVSYSFDEQSSAAPVGTSGSDRPNIESAFATWRDGKLELTKQLTISGKAVTQTEWWSVDPATGELIVETGLSVHHGYEAREDSPEESHLRQTRTVYRKR